jgi:transcriptional antiterminator RfaH
MIHWYAFQSKARKEQLLCEQLHIRNIDTFFPCLRLQSINSRAQKVKPYFPGYVFGHVDLERVGRSILDWIPGAIGIVSFGGEPAPVSDNLVDTLQRHLESINASAGGPSQRFKPGDVVTIRGGPLAGYEAIFDARLPGRDRAEVLLRILRDSGIRVELPIDQISLAAALPQSIT